MLAAGMHASRLDGSPLRPQPTGPLPAGSAMCRAEVAPILLRCHRRRVALIGARSAQKAGSPGPFRVETCSRGIATGSGVAGTGPQLRLARDSASQQVRPLAPGSKALYVCGITPCGAASGPCCHLCDVRPDPSAVAGSSVMSALCPEPTSTIHYLSARIATVSGVMTLPKPGRPVL